MMVGSSEEKFLRRAFFSMAGKSAKFEEGEPPQLPLIIKFLF